MQLLFQLFFLRKREKKVKIAFKLFCIFFPQGPSEREANDWVGSLLSTPASAVTPERGVYSTSLSSRKEIPYNSAARMKAIIFDEICQELCITAWRLPTSFSVPLFHLTKASGCTDLGVDVSMPACCALTVT